MKILNKAKGEMDYFEVDKDGPFLMEHQKDNKHRNNQKIGYKISWERIGGREGRLWLVLIRSREGEFFSKMHDHLTIRHTAVVLKKDELEGILKYSKDKAEAFFKHAREHGQTTCVR
jgi:hypothetical protein